MATKKEKEVLMQTLKFTPRTYTISLGGYGGEIVVGRVDRKIYDYFKDKDIDIEEYAGDWDNELEVPEDMMPFDPGSWHDCDNAAHESGVELDAGCDVTVNDEDGNEVWTHNLGIDDLINDGCAVADAWNYDSDTEDAGTCIYVGQSTEKGTFFGGEIKLTAPFDPTKLTFEYNVIQGWALCGGLTYDGEDIDNDSGGDTWGKGMYHTFVCIGEDDESNATEQGG
jgi:hypothetical protein